MCYLGQEDRMSNCTIHGKSSFDYTICYNPMCLFFTIVSCDECDYINQTKYCYCKKCCGCEKWISKQSKQFTVNEPETGTTQSTQLLILCNKCLNVYTSTSELRWYVSGFKQAADTTTHLQETFIWNGPLSRTNAITIACDWSSLAEWRDVSITLHRPDTP